MPLQKELVHCELCGAPLDNTTSDSGCLNCLLIGGLSESGSETRRFQHYEVCLCDNGTTLDTLGHGAMGTTYRALDVNLGSPVALKIISARYSDNPEACERFRREARTAAQLRHPNVASVFHFGETAEGQCFYAMELVEGETLEARVRRDGPLPPRLVLEIAIQVARALIAAEAHGLVHRDLKPSNLMVLAQESSDTDALLVKVIDFGLARAMAAAQSASDQTHAGFSGTPEFASPEQFGPGATPLDIRSDIYSLGATLWYLLCGNAPFAGRTTLEKRPDQPLPLEQLTAAKVPAPVVGVLRSMLAADPTQRPQSARELLTALRRCREALEVTPRRRRLLQFAALVMALGVLAVGLTSYLSRREHATPAIVMPDKSIAVLPFKNLSTDPENAFFADGMQDEVLTDLAKLADLEVISRTSAAHYKPGVDRNMRDIARELGAAYVVEGSAQRAGDRIRVSAQLINARTDSHLWAEHYDRQIADVFAIQSEIAQQIANQLHARLSPEEKTAIGERPTTDMRAYALYTEARAIGSWDDWKGAERSMAQKVDLLEEATQRDPKFVLAWCALAKVQDDFFVATGERTHLEMAKKAVDTAMQLRPDLGETRRELARYYFYANDYDRAYDELAVALRTLPNDSEALFVAGRIDRHKNRWDASLANLRKASALDPRNEEITYHLAQDYRYLRRYDSWKQDIEKQIGEERTDAWNQLGLAELKLDQGDLVGAQAVLAELPQDWSPTHEVWETRFSTALYLRDYDAAGRVIAATPAKLADAAFGGELPQSWADGLVARARGDEKKAQAVFSAARKKAEVAWGNKVKDEDYFAQIATLDAALGHKDEAMREARRAVDLMPITKDSWIGPRLVTNLAMVYAWTGEHDPAIGQLESLAKIPGGPTYGNLRFNPCWDSLRSDPRFEKIVASLAPSASTLAPLPEKSIAVLPLENLSDEKENGFLADGIQDELLSNLSKIKELKVISRTSVMQYKSGVRRNLKEIAQQLGVSNVVEGSVRRSGDHVRVSVQLIDAQTDRHIWVQNYDRTLADSLALQDELATEIAAALGATLTPKEKVAVQTKPTNNPAAYDAYLRGRAFAGGSQLDRSNVEGLIRSYQEAVKLDPSFALAWAYLSWAQSNIYWQFDSDPARLAAAKDCLDRAFALDPNLPETHLALGYYSYYGQRDFTGALAEFQKAEQDLPNKVDVIRAIALIQRRLGHWDEAIAGQRRAIELDPRNIDASVNLAVTYWCLRRFPEVLATADGVLAWEPTNANALWMKALALWARGDLRAVESLLANPGTKPSMRGVQAFYQRRYAAAIQMLSKALAGEPFEETMFEDRTWLHFMLGASQERAGNVAAARAIYQQAVQDIRRELEKGAPGHSYREVELHEYLGLAYAGLGEAASAIAEGEKALAADPTSKDPHEGPLQEEAMAQIYTLLGDADHAIPILKRLLQIPYGGGHIPYAGAITPALLQINPIWDQIRNDPRFQELAAGKKP